MLATTAQIIADLGISKVRLHELARAGKIPRGGRNQWDLEAVRAAIGRNLDVRQASPARGDIPAGTVGRKHSDPPAQRAEVPERGTFAQAQLMHEQAKAAKATIEVQRAQGKLIDRESVEREWSSYGVRFQNAVMGLASRMVNRLPAEWRREVQRVADEECRAILSSLSDEIRSTDRAA